MKPVFILKLLVLLSAVGIACDHLESLPTPGFTSVLSPAVTQTLPAGPTPILQQAAAPTLALETRFIVVQESIRLADSVKALPVVVISIKESVGVSQK